MKNTNERLTEYMKVNEACRRIVAVQIRNLAIACALTLGVACYAIWLSQ